MAAALAVLTGVAPGCASARYLGQAASGEARLLLASRPLAKAARDPDTPLRTRALLREVPRIRAYGEAQGLTPTRNYTSYVHLDRPAVVWVVSACEPLRFRSRTWSFPVVGTFPYLGWFDRAEAESYAAALHRDEGLDVDVRGASAYSTLGWLRDPLLSTMIPEGGAAPGLLADVVLHEMVHATVHVPGQSSFNESLASFAGERLAARYLERSRGAQAATSAAFHAALAASASRERAMQRAYRQLDGVYRSPLPDAEKLRRKAEILDALRAGIAWPRPINNATLATHRTYATGEEDFAALHAACAGSWPRFFDALRALDVRSFATAQQEDFGPVVGALARSACR